MANAETIYPELGESTTAQIEYTCAYGGKFYLTTALDLKGRGITANGDGSNHARGLKTFYATEAALDKLKLTYSTCYIALL
jgi:hypothetical protein